MLETRHSRRLLFPLIASLVVHGAAVLYLRDDLWPAERAAEQPSVIRVKLRMPAPPRATPAPARPQTPPVAKAEPAPKPPPKAKAAPRRKPVVRPRPAKRPRVVAARTPRPAPVPLPVPVPVKPTPPPEPEPAPPAQVEPPPVQAQVEPAPPAAATPAPPPVALSAVQPSAPPAPSADELAARKASYLEALSRLIDRHKSYPPVARRRGLEGAAKVAFTVRGNGQVAALDCSGRRPFDSAACDAVRHAEPLPPLPPGIGNRLDIHFTLRFRLVD